MPCMVVKKYDKISVLHIESDYDFMVGIIL